MLLLPVATKFHPQPAIVNIRFRQPPNEMFPFKVRAARRGRERAYVSKNIDLMLLEKSFEFFQGPRRMPDGPDRHDTVRQPPDQGACTRSR
jgi:hypothetical protein